MLFELLLYAELILFLVGTLLYGFLARELLRRPDVLPTNRPLRLFAVALTLWYGLTLVDVWLVLLLRPFDGPTPVGNAVDLLRALAWLAALPLLLHALERFDAATRERPSRAARVAVAVGWLAPLALVPTAWSFARSRSAYLAQAADGAYSLLVAVVLVELLPAAWLAHRLRRTLRAAANTLADTPPDRGALRLARFFDDLRLVLGLLAVAFVAGLVLDPWARRPDLAGGLLRLAILGGMLWPGLLFAWHVQRHNLLRLSLSNRALRQLATILGAVAVVVLAGPTIGLRDPILVRRLVAWGTLLALVAGLFGPRLLDLLSRRSRTVRSLLGRTVSPTELDALSRTIASLDAPPAALLGQAADALGAWLGAEVDVLPRGRPTEALWRHFERHATDDEVVHRLDRLSPPIASALDRGDLHAVVAIRVDTVDGPDLVGLLGLCARAAGGGHGDGEIDALRLVARQLAAALTLRRAAEARLARERAVAEQERLGMLGLMSASLAHEIKNPLSSMKALAQALREDLERRADRAPDLREGADDLEVIVEQIDRLDATARDILAFARPRPGPHVSQAVDLEALVRSAATLLRAEARKRAIDLELTVESGGEGLHAVAGSVAAWQTIAFNLLLNAVERTPRGGTVRASLRSVDGAIVFATENPGRLEPGLDPFAPFERAEGDDTSAGTAGLGLALVARRVAELGGTVRANTVRANTEADERVRVTVEIPSRYDPRSTVDEEPTPHPDL